MLTELLYLSKPMERYEDVVSLLNVADEVIQIMHPKAKKHNISNSIGARSRAFK